MLIYMISFAKLFIPSLMDGDTVMAARRWADNFTLCLFLAFWIYIRINKISELQILFYIPKILFYLPLILTNNWQQLHCGCIMSCHTYTELDYGGVGCSKCLLRSKKFMVSGEVISDVCVFMTCIPYLWKFEN